MANNLPKVAFKAGDDFLLTLTVSNKTSSTAIAADAAVVEAQATYDAALNAIPQVPLNTSNALTALNAAKNSYAQAIIVDITTWSMTSSMKWITRDVATFLVTKTDPLIGKFTIECPAAQTQLWKPRVYEADIQFTIGGKRTSSQTFQIDVKRDITIQPGAIS